MIIPSINSILKCEKLETDVITELVNKLDISEDNIKDKSKKQICSIVKKKYNSILRHRFLTKSINFSNNGI